MEIKPSNVAPRGADPARGVYYKLALFSFFIFAAPLTAYYISINNISEGNTTFAGGIAALVVNVVLVAYIVVAFLEDEGPAQGGAQSTARKIDSAAVAGVQQSKKDK